MWSIRVLNDQNHGATVEMTMDVVDGISIEACVIVRVGTEFKINSPATDKPR